MTSRYYDRTGERITEDEYRLLRRNGAGRVRLDREGDRMVSTVWLGEEHGPFPGALLIFETARFAGETLDGYSRHSSESAAIAAHEAACIEHLGREATPVEPEPRSPWRRPA